MKYAAYVGNDFCKIRVTPFFDTIPEARAAGAKTDHGVSFVAPCSNWPEHQRWNAARVGNYATCPVQE